MRSYTLQMHKVDISGQSLSFWQALLMGNALIIFLIALTIKHGYEIPGVRYEIIKDKNKNYLLIFVLYKYNNTPILLCDNCYLNTHTHTRWYWSFRFIIIYLCLTNFCGSQVKNRTNVRCAAKRSASRRI